LILFLLLSDLPFAATLSAPTITASTDLSGHDMSVAGRRNYKAQKGVNHTAF
jgi:hypothetical protein